MLYTFSINLMSSLDSNINFLVFNEVGTCLYHKEPNNNLLDPSFKGILQALFFTASEFNFSTKVLSTECGLIAYRKFEYKDSTILLCLIFPNNFGDETLTEVITQNILHFIYNAMLMHIGYYDLFHSSSPIEVEKIKKFFEIYTPTIDFILFNYSDPRFVFSCEKRYDINRDSLYSIKSYMESMKQSLKQDFVCLMINDGVIWSSSEWYGIESTDRILFTLIASLYSSDDISEIPIYFASTVIENNATGNIPFKMISTSLTGDLRLVTISDMSINISSVIDALGKQDEFFLQRLSNITIQMLFENETLNSSCSSMMVLNSSNKSYKVLVDEQKTFLFRELILNCNFCIKPITILSNIVNETKEESSQTQLSDEFYIKGVDFTLYYIQISNLFVFVLFPAAISFSEINEVKSAIEGIKKGVDEIKS